MTQAPTDILELDQVAIRVHASDNVCVAKTAIPAGTRIALESEQILDVIGEVTPGNRFAAVAIADGELVRQYGHPIGTSRGIAIGEPITLDNMSGTVPIVRDVADDLENPPPAYLAESERGTFPGFRRPDGRVGTRNFLLIVPTSMCASHEALQIATLAEFTLYSRERYPNVDGVVAIPHNRGCGCNDGSNLDVMMRTLKNYADHANVGGVIFLDLGCEKTNLELMDRHLRESGGFGWNKPTAWLGIQELGGTQEAIQRGLAETADMLPAVDAAQRVTCSASDLVLGVKCGASDGFSGLSANPALGLASDTLVRSGGTVVITEVPEFCGAEHVFAARARDASVARAVLETVDWYREYAARWGAALEDNPSPGNIAGGLLNIAIKSLGAMSKAGSTRVEGTCDYAERVKSPGLHLMQGPGYDQESTPGLVAAGCNAVVFTTGRGTTIGNAIAPVIKLSSNTATFERMNRDIDLNAGSVIDGTESVEAVGARLFQHVLRVAGGEVLAKAEEHKHREFQFWVEQGISL